MTATRGALHATSRVAGVWCAATSHPGLVRTHNEDVFVCDPTRGLFAVVDGMGGEKAGEVAAGIARDVLLACPDGAHPRDALQEANNLIVERGRRNPSERGMGCVMTAVRLRGDHLLVAHVGDTRAYLARSAGCEQLTRDHTAVAEAQEALGLSEAQARQLSGQHRVTRDLGRQARPDAGWIDTGTSVMEEGDLLVLASDGLHDMVPHAELSRALVRARKEGVPPRVLVDELVALALARGGRDNVTVVAVRRVPVRDPRKIRFLAAIFAVLLLLVGGLVGFELAARQGPGPEVRDVPLVHPVASLAEAGPGALVAAGPQVLDATLEFTGSVSALGALEVPAGSSVTRVRGGSDITLRGLEIRFAPGPSTWTIHLEGGARLVLRQASLVQPDLDLRVELEGEGSELDIVDSHLVLGSLVGQGTDGARLSVRGGHLDTRRGPPTMDGGQMDLGDAAPTPGATTP